eukprot:CAMPEP_0174735278 /NCGR_PEP_ID=MMETSP1094-20130205/64679_1 /TAXON_ID=156173 /ORGANISM="Chrysochromulina brevifilum, Strain UTEX LB 985" /LENGTH=143 /DNA_ID=CAMNT_0015938219 /DNA_START=1 /DNA_END=432 /DNA_ORIENTATION=-
MRMKALHSRLAALLEPLLPQSSSVALREVMEYFSSEDTLARFAMNPVFAPDFDAIAHILRGMYGIKGQQDIEGDGIVDLRECTIVEGRTPRVFRVIVLGMPPGSTAFCILPCCDSLVQLEVRRRARGIIFPQSDACLERCGHL